MENFTRRLIGLKMSRIAVFFREAEFYCRYDNCKGVSDIRSFCDKLSIKIHNIA